MTTINKSFRQLAFTNVDHFLTSSVIRDLRKATALDHAFQSEGRWSKKEKSNYITSLVLGMAPSKIVVCNIESCLKNSESESKDFDYFYSWQKKGFKSISVDGNNRTKAIADYFDDKVILEKGDYVLPDGKLINIDDKNNIWSKHPSDFKDYIEKDVRITITEYLNALRKDLTALFKCINDGMTLNAPELRNATLCSYASWVRDLKDLTYKTMLKKVFPSEKQRARRIIDDFIVSMSIYSTRGYLKDIQGQAKNSAYTDNSPESQTTKRAEKLIIGFANLIHKNASTNLKDSSELFNMFMAYTFLEDNKYVINNGKEFYDWFMAGEARRAADTNPICTTKTGESRTYQSCNRTMTKLELKSRYDYIHKDLLKDILLIATQKDAVRLFSPQERYVLWERQKGVCLATGATIPQSEINDDTKWAGDHIIPYASGGKTTIENGQLISKLANLQKSNKLPERR
jgi:5-methylcytosine-specific restriction endonuclease McrA